MGADRSLRDELEGLQAETRALRAELALAHAPEHLAQRAALEAAEREAAERATRATERRDRAQRERRALEARLVDLREQQRVEQQRRLGLVMLAVVPTLWVLLLKLGELRPWTAQLAPACCALVAFLLAPRALRWFKTGEAATRPGPGAWARANLTQNVGLAPLALAVAAIVLPLWLLGRARHRADEAELLLAVGPQLLAALAVLASVRGVRRADAGQGTHRALATAAGALALVPLAMFSLGGLLGLTTYWSEYDLLDWPNGTRALLFATSDALAFTVPGVSLLLWRLDALRPRAARRPWAGPLAGLYGVASGLLLWAVSTDRAAWVYGTEAWREGRWASLVTLLWLFAGAVLWSWTAWRARAAAPQQQAA